MECSLRAMGTLAELTINGGQFSGSDKLVSANYASAVALIYSQIFKIPEMGSVNTKDQTIQITPQLNMRSFILRSPHGNFITCSEDR